MLGVRSFFALVVALFGMVACNAGGISGTPAAPAAMRAVPQWKAQRLARRACPDPAPGHVQCQLLIENERGNKSTGYGWTPTDLQKRYNLPSWTKGAGQIVAIVDAYDNPQVASDLAAYRLQFGLGTANFYKYNQLGQQSNYPQGDTAWGAEIDLDVEMVSAICPKCTIYLIEANDSAVGDMETAEAEAVTLGAHVVSNSWLCYASSCILDELYFNAPGVVYTAASGDDGYGQDGPPMKFGTVVSVGGTVLKSKGTGYSEEVWGGAGSGCSTTENKPKWQHDPSCSARTDNDVSAVAYGVASYDTYGQGGWIKGAGTSVAAPIIAGVFALAGNASSMHAGKNFWSLDKNQRHRMLHYIANGNNGTCGGSYLCTAGTRQYETYSGPAGWGTPNGIGAF